MLNHRGFFWVGVWHAKHRVNIGTLFRSAFAYGATGIFTVGRRFEQQASDTTKSFRHVPCLNFLDIDDLLQHLPYATPLIGVELSDKATPLPKFQHPERACYLLGAEDHGLSDNVMSRCHYVVTIPETRYCLNVSVAGSIVMYDRQMKRGS